MLNTYASVRAVNSTAYASTCASGAASNVTGGTANEAVGHVDSHSHSYAELVPSARDFSSPPSASSMKRTPLSALFRSFWRWWFLYISSFFSALSSFFAISLLRCFDLPGFFLMHDLSCSLKWERVTPTLLTRNFAFGSSHHDLLAERTTCIPLALYDFNIISFSQALRLKHVTSFAQLPRPIKESLARSRHSRLLFRLYPGHIESSLRPILNFNYRLVTLRQMLTTTSTILATPYTQKEATPSMELTSPTLPMLGGVRSVLTQLATSYRAPNLNDRWHPTLFPRQATDVRNVYEFSHRRINVVRRHNYIRSFPANHPNARQPEHFEDRSLTAILAREAPRAAHAHSVPTGFNRNWMRSPITDRILEQTHAGLANILDGSDYTRASFQAAEQAVGMNRFLDTRGNKTVPRWEADAWNRWSGLTNLYQIGRADRSYYQIAYRLLSRYYAALVAQEFPDFQLAPVAIGTGVALTPLSTQLPPVPFGAPAPQVQNPEAPLFAPGAFEGLKNGTKQFIDAEGLSESEVIELLSAIVPQGRQQRLQFSKVNDQGQREEYFCGPTRYTYDNRVNEVFIHYGNNPIPLNMAQLAAQVHRTPQPNQILSVLRYLLMRHGAGTDIDDAAELLISRIALYSTSSGLRGLRNNAPNQEYINADGHYELHLPLSKTASAYFDCFFVPCLDSGTLGYFSSFSAPELINQGVLFGNARVVALNWAATAWSMVGRSWTNLPGTENNPFIRNHIDVWLRRYSSDILNLWSSCHNNTLALQYGFGVDSRVRATEAGRVVNWWSDHQAPYLANPYHELWLAEKLPSHQTLPYDDSNAPSTVSWPSQTPFPISDMYSFSQNTRVELARDVPIETARSWMVDGGPTVNAQHYLAVGRPTGYRFEGAANTPNVSLARWRQRHPYQFPQAPANQNVVWMDAGGSPFADFALPGSIPTVNLEQNVAYTHGLQLANDCPQADRTYLSQLWFDTARQTPRRSLMINYVSPFPDRREFSTLQDYSTVVWEKGNTYAGMSLIPVDFAPTSIADYHPNPQLPMPNVTRPSAADVSDVTKGRVARVRNTHKPRVRSNVVVDRLREYHQELSEPEQRISGALSYEPKYPVEQSEVPPMQNYTAHVNGPEVSITDADTGAFTRLQKREMLQALQTNMALMAKLQASPLLASPDSEELVQDSAARRASYEAQQNRIAQRLAQAKATTSPKPRVKLPPPPARPAHSSPPTSPAQPVKTVQVVGQLNEDILRHKPVEVNDAAAPEVQIQAQKFAKPLDRASGLGSLPSGTYAKGKVSVMSPEGSHDQGPDVVLPAPPPAQTFAPDDRDSLNAAPADGLAVSSLAEN
ncbi:hypothetical protein [Fusarium poae dsRNA virus 3]|uniref:Uncharacterized protein n=1 Tax=Fusarium poae dsRNA virus 3 TaxID=1848169 RepID=A0A2Z1Q3B3_9VIRU|nr:hypothetical protein [Fusarium poae dsRNA virus 3]ANE10466.1 hypothetical protein [Fusarium poae dsRNA virus 3]